MSKFCCIYHGNCADGFASAWAVDQAFKEQKLSSNPVDWNDPSLKLVAGVYQNPFDKEAITDAHVIIVDFSYKRSVIRAMSNFCRSITIIDHHKTAIADLEQIELDEDVKCPIYTRFDTQNSGAMLTWNYYFPANKSPRLLQHIEDRDLWKFRLPGTRDIQANLFSYPYDLPTWDSIIRAFDQSEQYRHDFIVAGSAIERKHFKDIAELTTVGMHYKRIGGVRVPCLNVPYTLASDAGNSMCQATGDKPQFAACFFINGNDEAVFSLRSLDEGQDVSEIAKLYGGGGHKNAAGFKVTMDRVHRDYVEL